MCKTAKNLTFSAVLCSTESLGFILVYQAEANSSQSLPKAIQSSESQNLGDRSYYSQSVSKVQKT